MTRPPPILFTLDDDDGNDDDGNDDDDAARTMTRECSLISLFPPLVLLFPKLLQQIHRMSFTSPPSINSGVGSRVCWAPSKLPGRRPNRRTTTHPHNQIDHNLMHEEPAPPIQPRSILFSPNRRQNSRGNYRV